MEAWVLILALNSGMIWGSSIRQIDMQNEDACVMAAKEMTLKAAQAALCVSQFDGKVLYFVGGKQVS